MSQRALIEQVLKRRGITRINHDSHGIVAACPFHADNEPSFSIRDDGLYICYSASCGAKGNLYMFLRHVAKYDHDKIEQMVGPTQFVGKLPDIPAFRDRFANKSVETVPETMAVVYGAFCPKYMLERGFTKKTLRTFGIGLDTETGQVMIPVRTPEKELVGFIRRATREDDYLRYKVEVANGRGNIMYNIHQTQGRQAIIVEGALDCMWVHQAGLPNVVALLGSTLSHAQVDLLKARFDSFVLMLDNDATGHAATVQHTRRLQAFGQVFVAARFPEGKDAADNTAEAVNASYENRVQGLAWMLENVPTRYRRRQDGF